MLFIHQVWITVGMTKSKKDLNLKAIIVIVKRFLFQDQLPEMRRIGKAKYSDIPQLKN